MSNSTLPRILWIEDQPEENDGFTRECKIEGFNLENARTSEEGIAKLRNNPDGYAGVILDALGYKESTEEALKTSGLHHALREIRALVPDIPKLVFTGQERFVGNDDFKEDLGIPVFYKQDDNDALFDNLREQIANRPDAELRRRYPEVCSLCDDEFLPASKWSETLFPALKEAHEGTHNPDRFTGLRKVLEAALKSLCSNGILPECFDDGGQVNLKYCELLLCGRSVTPHNQETLHFFPSSKLLDETDQSRLQLLKILTSEESHENQLHRTVADLSCAVFTLVSLLPALKALSQAEPKWTTIDLSGASYEIPGKIHNNGRFFTPSIKITSHVKIDELICTNSLQPHDKIWVKCRAGKNGYHDPIAVRPFD